MTAKPDVAPAQPSTAPARKLPDRAFGVASFKYNRWAIDLDETMTLEDVLKPEFLANQADKVRGHDRINPRGIGDIIEVRKRDIGLYAEVIVAEVGNGYMRTELVRQHEPAVATLPKDCPLTTRWNAGAKTHEVIRVADKVVMATAFQTKPKAIAWITDHLDKLAG